jgi:hypothetical protein
MKDKKVSNVYWQLFGKFLKCIEDLLKAQQFY